MGVDDPPADGDRQAWTGSGTGRRSATCHEQEGEEVLPEGQRALSSSSDSLEPLPAPFRLTPCPALVSGEATGKHHRVRTGKARAGETIFMELKRLTPKGSVHTGWPWAKVFSRRGRSVWSRGKDLALGASQTGFTPCPRECLLV